MTEPLDPKDVRRKVLTEDGVVCEGPCLLVTIVATMASTQRWVKIRDGINTSGELIMELQGSAKASVTYDPHTPDYMAQGIYIELENSVTSVVVRYKKLQQSG